MNSSREGYLEEEELTIYGLLVVDICSTRRGDKTGGEYWLTIVVD